MFGYECCNANGNYHFAEPVLYSSVVKFLHSFKGKTRYRFNGTRLELLLDSFHMATLMTQNTANTKNASKETETTKNEPDGKSTTFVNTPNENPVAAAICVKYTPTTKAATKGTTEETTGRFL